MSDDVPTLFAETPQQVIQHTAAWILDMQTQLERLAAATGKAQSTDLGMRGEDGRVLLRIQLTCEPRQFAKRTIEGEWAALFKSLP
jgi:hypothetical protein